MLFLYHYSISPPWWWTHSIHLLSCLCKGDLLVVSLAGLVWIGNHPLCGCGNSILFSVWLCKVFKWWHRTFMAILRAHGVRDCPSSSWGFSTLWNPHGDSSITLLRAVNQIAASMLFHLDRDRSTLKGIDQASSVGHIIALTSLECGGQIPLMIAYSTRGLICHNIIWDASNTRVCSWLRINWRNRSRCVGCLFLLIIW